MSLSFKPIYATLMRNRRILPGIAIIGIFAMLLIVRAAYNYHINILHDIADREELYKTSSSMLDRGSELSMRMDYAQIRVKKLEKGLLNSDKPFMAAAKLEETL